MPESGTGRETGAHTQQLLRQAPLPDLVGIRRLVRRRRHRRLGVVAGSIVLVLAALAGAVAFGPRQDRGHTSGTPAPSPSARIFHYSTAALGADARAGLSLGFSCRAGVGACQMDAATTADGGRTWRATPALPMPLPGGLSAQPGIVGGTPALLDMTGRPLLVLNAGRRWAPLADRTSGPDHLGAGPGWTLSTRIGQVVGRAPDHNTVSACDVGEATCAPMLHQPPIDRVTWVRIDQGRLWAAGLSAGGAARLAESDDRGHSWHETTLAGPKVDTVTITDTAGGLALLIGSRYRGESFSEGWRVTAFWTTADDARSTHLIGATADLPLVATAALLLPNRAVALVQTLVPGASGSGIVSLLAGPALRVSADGGRTYGRQRFLPQHVLSLRRVGDSGRCTGWTASTCCCRPISATPGSSARCPDRRRPDAPVRTGQVMLGRCL